MQTVVRYKECWALAARMLGACLLTLNTDGHYIKTNKMTAGVNIDSSRTSPNPKAYINHPNSQYAATPSPFQRGRIRAQAISATISYCPMLKPTNFRNSFVHGRRCLATASASTTVTPPAPKSRLREALETGPSFDDFVAERVPERVVLTNLKG